MRFDGTCVETLHLFRGTRRGRVAKKHTAEKCSCNSKTETRGEQDGAKSSRRFNVGDESRADLIYGIAPQPLAETLLVKEAGRDAISVPRFRREE